MPTDQSSVPVVNSQSLSRDVGIRAHTTVQRTVAHTLVMSCLLLTAGCSLFEHPVERVAPSPLGWLTSWNNQPLASTKPFDLETIRPATRQPLLGPDALLEVTVWDLYEPGRPHTFPVRVTAKKTVEIPLLGEQPIADRGLPEIETALSDEFRRRDLLKTPRVLVRSLESGHFRVQVTGAVVRPGFVELSRDQANVYDALVAAGGLKSLAGTQIAVTHRDVSPTTTAQSRRGAAVIRGQSPDDDSKKYSGPQIRPASSGGIAMPEPPASETESEAAPEQDREEPAASSGTEQKEPAEVSNPKATPRANRIEEVSVPLPPRNAIPDAGKVPTATVTPSATPAASNHRIPSANDLRITSPGATDKRSNGDRVTWFDVSREADRAVLQSLVLVEGDMVQVKAAAAPIRIAGSVARPGDYALPAGKVLDLWQALELAGGVKTTGTPLVITLLRPPADGRGPQRWQRQFESLEKAPADLPKIQPGDVIDINPPTGTRLKKAVGGLWSR